MTEVVACTVVAAGGIVGENRGFTKRGVTLVSKEAWSDVCRELGVNLPWYARRANLLIEGLDLGAALGQTLAVGSVRLLIHGETRPCGLMDKQHLGLKAALVPDFRGGVYGQVLNDGAIRVGDEVRIAPSEPRT